MCLAIFYHTVEQPPPPAITTAPTTTTTTIVEMNNDENNHKKNDNGNNNSNNKNKNSERRQVYFCSIADKVHPVIPKRSELSESEIHKLWYKETDLVAAKREIRKTLSMLRDTTTSTSTTTTNRKEIDSGCARGLEQQTDRLRKFHAIRVGNALLEEQKRQKSLGLNDPEQLAQVYGAKAVYAQETAVLMAQEDQKEAEMAMLEGFLDPPEKAILFHMLGSEMNDKMLAHSCRRLLVLLLLLLLVLAFR
jgi:hypothetical protein